MYKPINEKAIEKLVSSGTVKIILIDEVSNEHCLSLNNENIIAKLFNFRLSGFKNNYMCLNLTAGPYVGTNEKFELYLSVLIHILKKMVVSGEGKGFLSIKSKDRRVLEPLYESGIRKIKAGRSLSKGDDEIVYSGMSFFGSEGIIT